jgi:hypothetical protein
MCLSIKLFREGYGVNRLAETRPRMLARMHGSAWRGDGKEMLLALADALER